MEKGRDRKYIDEFCEAMPQIIRVVSKATIGKALLTSSQEMAQSERCTCGIEIKEARRLCTERDCPYK